MPAACLPAACLPAACLLLLLPQLHLAAHIALVFLAPLVAVPFGMIALDFLMFLEPFGLLAVVPLPDRLRQFIPAYKSTRIIAEVAIESLPQCVLQSYILVTVMHHVNGHAASSAEMHLLSASIDGATFGEILPRSITISTITSAQPTGLDPSAGTSHMHAPRLLLPRLLSCQLPCLLCLLVGFPPALLAARCTSPSLHLAFATPRLRDHSPR